MKNKILRKATKFRQYTAFYCRVAAALVASFVLWCIILTPVVLLLLQIPEF